MLEELVIRNVGVIDEVELALGPGLNVLTGETGTGKTMVVSALELLRGARADSDQVRSGALAAVVEGRLRPVPPGAEEWITDGDDELVVSREVAAEGRSRARVGGRLAPVSALAETVGAVIELHGQQDSARLGTPATQRELLDRFGDETVAHAFQAYRATYDRWRDAQDELARLQADERERARELDRLTFELGEIDGVRPAPGEEDALEATLRRLEHAEGLAAAASTGRAAVAGEGGARDALGAVVAALRPMAGLDAALDALLARVEGVAAETQDLALELTAYSQSIDLDPAELERLRERRAALAGLARKYGPDAAAIVAYAEEARSRLAELSGGAERAEALGVEVRALSEEVQTRAEALTETRRKAGRQLATAVESHLDELRMSGARMDVSIEPVEPGPTGADRVTFLLAANPGEPALPLGKAASGGERSRVALAVRLALADADDTPVVVFDEVDAGIGGETARVVGEKLARLAQGRQVLCVTHLPQLAAFADTHFAVTKTTTDGRTRAAVVRLDEPGRLPELARMLSGAPDSEAAARHAAELRDAALAASGSH